MLKDCLRAEDVTIYRLNGIDGYDFTLSDEGEVEEDWEIVVDNVMARFRWDDSTFSRRSDGIVQVGGHKCYFDKDIDVLPGDRILRPFGETGPEFYSVRTVKTIRDSHWQIHHKEIQLDHIDWEVSS